MQKFHLLFSKKIEDTKKCNDIIDLPFFQWKKGVKILLGNRVTHSLRDDFGLKGNYKEMEWQNQKCLFETRKCNWKKS